MMYLWKRAREHRQHGHSHHAGGPCGSGGGPGFGSEGRGRFGGGSDEGGGGFGVRRPLRFLAHKLDLTEPQVNQVAKIMSDLKTERAQAEVDQQRTLAAFADAISGATFDAARAAEGHDLRTKTAERLRDAVEKALAALHAVLNGDQRGRFAYMLRTGVVVI